MIFLAASLAVASGMHLSGVAKGRSAPFNPTEAGIAEAVIGAVLLAAAIPMLRRTASARLIGIAGAAFAIVGFLFGLMFTTLGGHWPDIAYHLTVLPMLFAIVLILGRSDREGHPTSRNQQELLS
jgi:peptidoglycan/LPS O-acetylase OafA/YrhL